MDAAQRQPAQRPVAPYAAATATLWVAAAGLCALFAPEPVRGAVFAGVLAAGLGGAISLLAIAAGVKKGTNGLLAGFAAGFAARMVLVAVGLIASGAQGRAALLYAASFFALYAATQAVEIAYVWACSRAARAAAKA